MKNITFYIILTCSFPAFSQVEISPTSVNAELRVNSATKGILLPRVNSPSLVNSPEEGLMIYDKATKAPAFHDGAKWNSMMMPMPSVVGTDSLTYTFLTGYGPLIQINNPLPLLSMSMGASFPGAPNNITWQSFNFSKAMDLNTIPLITIFGNKPATTNIVIEIKVYKKGTNLHYFSYKFSNIILSSVQFGALTGSTGQVESFSMEAKIFAWKNNITGQSVGFDTTTGAQVTY